MKKRYLMIAVLFLALLIPTACKKASDETSQAEQEQRASSPVVGEWFLDVERTVALMPEEQRGLATMMMGQMRMTWDFNDDGTMRLSATARDEVRNYDATYETEELEDGDLRVTMRPTEETIAEIRAESPEDEEVEEERQLRVTVEGENQLRIVRLEDGAAPEGESVMILRRVGSEDEADGVPEEEAAGESDTDESGEGESAAAAEGERQDIEFSPELLHGTWRFDADTTLAGLSAEQRAFGEMVFRQVQMNITFDEDGAMRMFVGAMGNFEEVVGTWELQSHEGSVATLLTTPDLDASTNARAGTRPETMIVDVYSEDRLNVADGDDDGQPMVLRRVPADELDELFSTNQELLESSPAPQAVPVDDGLPVAEADEAADDGAADEGTPEPEVRAEVDDEN